jgi:hypothetical protein
MIRCLLLSFLPLALLACPGSSVQRNHPTAPDAVLPLLIRYAGFGQVVVLDSTELVRSEDLGWLLQGSWADTLRPQLQAAVADLQAHGQTRWPLDTTGFARLGAQPATHTPSRDTFTGPHGPTVFTFSPMGFNRDSTVAAVFWTYYCGDLCAGGQFSFFRRNSNGAWALWHSERSFVS